MLTEDEAKTKLCVGPPGCGRRRLVHSVQHCDGSADTNTYGEDRYCAGSACMAWRSVPAGQITHVPPQSRFRWEKQGYVLESEWLAHAPDVMYATYVRPAGGDCAFIGLAGKD